MQIRPEMQMGFVGLHLLLVWKIGSRRLMINYSQYEDIQYPQLYFELLHSEPHSPPHHLHDPAYPATSDDHNQERSHPDDHPTFPSDIIEESDQNLSVVSEPPHPHDPLKQEELSESSKIRRRMERRLKNETKNIPKNFGKGIISFIEKNERKIRGLLAQQRVGFANFKAMVRSQKKIINTIADLRRLWTDPTYGRCMRIISNLFFRRYSMHYIFNSRISNFGSHIKYRHSLWAALRTPHDFNHIKQY